jgi:hypothetical protein
MGRSSDAKDTAGLEVIVARGKEIVLLAVTILAPVPVGDAWEERKTPEGRAATARGIAGPAVELQALPINYRPHPRPQTGISMGRAGDPAQSRGRTR